MKKILLEEEYLTILKDILRTTLPNHANVWIFGSRASGKPKKFSDIDLAIDMGAAIPLDLQVKLEEEFTESSLPYKVDFVDIHRISEDFLVNIQQQRIPIIF